MGGAQPRASTARARLSPNYSWIWAHFSKRSSHQLSEVFFSGTCGSENAQYTLRVSKYHCSLIKIMRSDSTYNAVTAPERQTSHWRVSDDLSSTSWFAYTAASSVSASLWLENHLDLMTSLFLALYHTSHEFLAFLQIKKRWKMAKKLQVQWKYVGFIISYTTNRLYTGILPQIPLLLMDRFYFLSYMQINDRRGITLPITILTCNYVPLKYFQHRFPLKSPQITKHQNVNT